MQLIFFCKLDCVEFTCTISITKIEQMINRFIQVMFVELRRIFCTFVLFIGQRSFHWSVSRKSDSFIFVMFIFSTALIHLACLCFVICGQLDVICAICTYVFFRLLYNICSSCVRVFGQINQFQLSDCFISYLITSFEVMKSQNSCLNYSVNSCTRTLVSKSFYTECQRCRHDYDAYQFYLKFISSHFASFAKVRSDIGHKYFIL